MDHTFPSAGTTTGAKAKRHNHHQHHQQSVRNSLSPSPAALNSYYRISPSPTNIGSSAAILTASALNTPGGVGVSALSYNKSSPSPSCYQSTASPATQGGVNVSVSNLYRLQMLTVQQQQQQQHHQQQLPQYIQHQQLQTPPTQVQIHSQSQSPNSSEAYSHSHNHNNQTRVVSGHNSHSHNQQYPVRIQQQPQAQPQQHSGNILQQQQQHHSRSPQTHSAYSTSPNSNPLSEVNFRSHQHSQQQQYQNQQQPQTQTPSHSDSHHHLQYQQQQQRHSHHHSQPQHQPTQQQQQYHQNLTTQRNQSQSLHQTNSQSQGQKMPNNPQNQNKNQNRIVNNFQQQQQQQPPQATINNNSVPQSTTTTLVQGQNQNQNLAQQQSQIGNSSASAAAPANVNKSVGGVADNAPTPTTQPQYRIFKRGDSIPGISSPIQITAQVNNNANQTSGNDTAEIVENWDDPIDPGTGSTGGNSAGEATATGDGNKENSESSPKSSNDKNKNENAIRTPLSQIGEIARFHAVQVEYRLVKETGPPHAPTFTVLLHLGNEEYTGEGPSIKKAQHAAAVEALEKTSLTRPPPRVKPKNKFNPVGGATGNRRPNWALIQLTNLAQELQLPIQFVQQPVAIVDPFRRGDPPSVVSVHVGERIFTGEGSNFNSAKNMAVMVALKAMMKVKQEIDMAKLVQAGADAEQSMMDADNKSPISIVHEMAMKRSLNVAFEIVQETGPPHMKVFTVKCKVGEEMETEGQGPTKQAAKKASSELMIAKLKEIPIQVPNTSQGLNLKAVQRGLLRQKLAKKKTSTPVVKDLEKQTVSPISRLIQICHIKKLKEPEFILISTGTETNVENFLKQITERDRRMLRKKKPVFTIEVTVGSHACRGTGPNKKAAKKAAAEAAIIALGYGPTEGADEADGEKPSAKESSGSSEKAGTNGNSSGGGGNQSGKGSGKGGSGAGKGDGKSGGSSVKLSGARQIAPGIIVLKQENSGAATSTAAAQEMKKVNNLVTSTSSSSGTASSAQSSREGIEKLAYLSKLLDISVSYSDFPKKNEYLSVVSLTTNPPHVAHGCGATLEEAQNAAALKILEELSTMDLDSVTAAAEKPSE